jgi:hypothetical protein
MDKEDPQYPNMREGVSPYPSTSKSLEIHNEKRSEEFTKTHRVEGS